MPHGVRTTMSPVSRSAIAVPFSARPTWGAALRLALLDQDLFQPLQREPQIPRDGNLAAHPLADPWLIDIEPLRQFGVRQVRVDPLEAVVPLPKLFFGHVPLVAEWD